MADKLTPPPSKVPFLDTTGKTNNSAWMTWLFNLYEQVKENMSSDFYLDVAAGRVTGHSVVNKFGENGSVATSSIEHVWDGSNAYTFPSSASITHIRSAVDSVNTQGLDVEVQGLDTNWVLTVQTATLDGTNSTTEVALTTALRRVFRMKVVDTSATSADQDIWVGATGMAAATAKGIIQATFNQTLMAIYTVPANKTAYITDYYASLNKAAGGGSTVGVKIRLWEKDNANGYPAQIKHVLGLDSSADSSFNHEFEPYSKYTEKTDLYITAQNLSASVTADVSAGFDLILVDN